ncbi:peroxidasin homolog [Esox lucius]|uniref:peroxidasin homolog n=1 Tax=Esox lucius TaxID=8010 RepID=UPI0009731C0E|nr:peroxidasin homolog [Esox lucius]
MSFLTVFLLSTLVAYPLSVSVQAKLTSVVLKANPGLLLVQGEALTLTCIAGLVPGSHNNHQQDSEPSPLTTALTYSIQRGNTTVSSGSQVLLIDRVTKSHSGKYRCNVTDQSGTQRYSKEVQVTVDEGLLMPTLSVEPTGGQVYGDNTVTFACHLPGHPELGWQFYWYKDRRDTGSVEQVWGSAGGGAVYRLWRASVTHTGQYWCRAGRGQPVFYTNYSQTVSVNVTEVFISVTLSASPSTVVKEGSAFNLSCEAQVSQQSHGLSHPGHNWTEVVVKFTFLRNGWPVMRDSVSGLYRVARASSCYMGTYSCVASTGRSRRSSHEVIITLDNLSLILVTCFGTVVILSVAPVAFLMRLCFMRCKWQHSGSQCDSGLFGSTTTVSPLYVIIQCSDSEVEDK